MYLVINLAVLDMFVGGVAVYDLFYRPGKYCNLWNWHSTEVKISVIIIITVLFRLFLFGSLINIAIIALERVHATFCPFKHRLLKKWVYRLIIAVVWVTSGLVAISCTLPIQFDKGVYGYYLHVTFISICLLIICVSYTSIVVKVRCGAQPQHHGATSRERKLTMTLLIVTVASLLVYLPYVIVSYVLFISKFEIMESPSFSSMYHLHKALLVLLYSNSLVNPILYAIRMPEYRSALFAFLRTRPQQHRQVAVFSLRDM